jgi:release factor glutamine methyltransferase
LSTIDITDYASANVDRAALEVYQRQMHDMLRATETGTIVEYLGKEFIVHKNVFWPGDDSIALVENYVVQPGEDVLDLCTGSGHIAVFSASKGARSVVALDINPAAVANAEDNAARHGYSDVITVRRSDMFAALEPERKFGVITMNPPCWEHALDDVVSRSTWDEKLHVHKEFFAHAHEHLKPSGRSYVAVANFGPVEAILQMASDAGYAAREIGRRRKTHTTLVFYAFEFQRGAAWSN